MVRKYIVAAAALLFSYMSSANAAPNPEHKSRNAQKIIATLDKLGINHKVVRDFVTETDSHIKRKGYFTLRETNIAGGRLSLQCQTRGFPTARKFELIYEPEYAPHFNITARTNGIEMRYHLDF